MKKSNSVGSELETLKQRLKKIEEENEFFTDWALELQKVTRYSELLNMVGDEIRDRLGYSTTSFYILLEKDSDDFLLVAGCGEQADTLREVYPVLPAKGDAMIEEILRGEGPVIVEDARTDPRTNKEIVAVLDYVSIINVPMHLIGKCIGSLGVATSGSQGPHVPNKDELALLKKMATHIAPVIERIRFIEQQKETEQALRKAMDSLDRANKVKIAFLSQMSHELRTPLNAIIGFSGLLRMDQALSNKVRDEIQVIENAGKQLAEMVSAILDMTEIESSSIEPTLQLINMATIVDEAAENISGLTSEKGVRIENKINPAVQKAVVADIDCLRQALTIILKNAVQYNVKNGWVNVTLKDEDSETLHISVEDSGVGIEASIIEKIFEPFERGQAYNLGIDGAGIGLTMAKILIESMGGNIGVESKPGKGSGFWLELPVSPKSL